jgi:hypothetical protein
LWLANLVTSIPFVAIHLPGWIALHPLKVETAATIFRIRVRDGSCGHVVGLTVDADRHP